MNSLKSLITIKVMGGQIYRCEKWMKDFLPCTNPTPDSLNHCEVKNVSQHTVNRSSWRNRLHCCRLIRVAFLASLVMMRLISSWIKETLVSIDVLRKVLGSVLSSSWYEQYFIKDTLFSASWKPIILWIANFYDDIFQGNNISSHNA